MLQRKHRLAKNKDVSQTYARGRGFFSPFFTIKAFFKPLGPSQFAVVVSTKVSKKATDRNRLRRIVREYIRLNMQSFRSANYIVTIKPQAKNLEAKDLRQKFNEFATKTVFSK